MGEVDKSEGKYLTTVEAAGLPVVVGPTKQLVFALVDKGAIGTNLTAKFFSDHPRAIQEALAMAYYQPVLVEVDEIPTLTSELEEIRKTFPNVIRLTGSINFAQSLLDQFPLVADQVDSVRKVLAEYSPEITKTIEDSELILKVLIDSGANRNLSMEEYYRVNAAHGFFMALSDNLYEVGEMNSLDFEEREKFIRIGTESPS